MLAAFAALVALNAGITWGTYDTISSARVDGTRQHVLIPQFGDNEGDPSWSHDGRAIAYFGSFSDTSWLYVFRPATHKTRVLKSKAGRSSKPTWSPDGKRIAVMEDGGPYGMIRQATIEIVSVATNQWVYATRPRRNRVDTDPAWSPDGQTIAFARQDHGPQTIYLMRPNGTGLHRLTIGHSPSWSPDGKSIAYSLGNAVYVINDDGAGRRLVVGGLRNPDVRWSPDGRKLLYTSDNDAWTVNVDGTHRRRVLHDTHIEGIAWRPSGR